MLQVLAALLLAPAPLRAAPDPAPAVRGVPRGFVEPGDLDSVAARLAPPPAPGSPRDRADLAAVRAWQARRTPQECARASAEADPSYEHFFGALSPFPTPLDGQERAFFGALAADAGLAAEAGKLRYSRPRPYERDAAIKPCVPLPGGYSYPSGHATLARLDALVLSDLLPARRATFLARGDEAALDRVIGGVHHPSDVEAGKSLGDALYAKLETIPAFRAEVAWLRLRLLVRGPRTVVPSR